MQTAFTECSEGKGGHHQPALLIVELLDENNRQVKIGEPGEVTITTLGVEAMPLLRYKTGDICIAFDEPCLCGRKTLRLSPVIGRKKQMIKFKGTTLYPPALFDLLNEMEEIKDFVAEVYSNEIGRRGRQGIRSGQAVHGEYGRRRHEEVQRIAGGNHRIQPA